MNDNSFEAVIHAAAKRLDAARIDNAYFEAKQLLKHAQRRAEDSAALPSAEPISKDDIQRFEALIARRLLREPLQHILGSTGFHNITLATDHRALIPRSDSETVVELALEFVPGDGAVTIADLGTGSGALLATLLTERPNVRGIAVEASVDALSLAEENFEKLGMADRIDVFSGSWSGWTAWRDCHLIISNPPYIRTDVIPTLAPEVRDFDPVAALDGGADGLAAYREIAALAATKMRTGAHLILEIGYDQRETVSELLRTAGLTVLATRRDLTGNDRAIAAQKR